MINTEQIIKDMIIKMKLFRKKRQLAVFLAASVCALLLPGCSQKRESLAVGFDSEFPPFSYTMEDGSYTGFDIELAEAVCELEGWKMEPVPIYWDEKDSLLNSGAIDCIWCGFTINGREKDYALTVPYCENSCVVVVPYNADIDTFDDLAGKMVGVQAASSGAEYLTGNEEGKALSNTFKLLSQFTDYSAAYQALEEGLLDAVISDSGIAKYYTTDNYYGVFRVLEGSLTEELYGVAFSKDNAELCETLNADLKKLAENGTLNALAEKYGIEEWICIGRD